MTKESKKLEIMDWDYSSVKGLNRWGSKHEFEVVKKKLARFEELLIYRRTGCFWSSVPASPEVSIQDILTYNEGSTSQGSGTGSNWNTRWDFLAKAKIMWKKYLEEYSNVKSPLSWSTMLAFMSQFGSSNQTVNLGPEDENSIEVLEQYIRKWEVNGNITKSKRELADSTGTYGTAISFNPYILKIRPNDVVLNGDKAEQYLSKLQDSKDEADVKKYEYLKKQLDKNKPIIKEIEVIDYEDPAIIPVSLYEFYPDDHASEINGLNKECNDVDWRRTRSLKDVKAEYENSDDPFIIKRNIEKLMDTADLNAMYGSNERFFKSPSDLKNTKGKVAEHNFYDRQEKSWVTIINDVLVREGPLPYDHGLIPFSKYIINRLDDQFYGIGFVDQLESFQALDETGLNMHVESRKLSENPPMVVNENIFPSISEQYTRLEPRQIIRADGPVGEDNLRWFEGPSGSVMDLVSYRNMVTDDATRSSGINDLAFASSSPNEAVRNNMQAMQSTNQIIKYLISVWAEGYKDAMGQIISILGQKMPDKLENEDNQNINFEGVKLQDMGNGKILKGSVNGSHPFKLEPEHFIFTKSPRITIDIDSLLPMSSNVMMQRSEAIMVPPVMAMFANPQYKADPLIMAIFRDYFKKHNFPTEIIDYFAETNNSETDVQLANEQMNDIVTGKTVPGKPGMSQLHIATENNFAMDLILEVNGIGAKHSNDLIKKITDEGIDPREILDAVLKHISLDATPPDLATSTVMGVGQSVLQPPQPQQPQPQQQGQVPPAGPVPAPPQPMQTPTGAMGMPAQSGGMPAM